MPLSWGTVSELWNGRKTHYYYYYYYYWKCFGLRLILIAEQNVWTKKRVKCVRKKESKMRQYWGRPWNVSRFLGLFMVFFSKSICRLTLKMQRRKYQFLVELLRCTYKVFLLLALYVIIDVTFHRPSPPRAWPTLWTCLIAGQTQSRDVLNCLSEYAQVSTIMCHEMLRSYNAKCGERSRTLYCYLSIF